MYLRVYNVCVPQIFLLSPQFLPSLYDSMLQPFSPRALHVYKKLRIDSLPSNPTWMVLLHCRAISLVGMGREEANTEKATF